MNKNSRIILIFPLLFVLISMQTAWGYWAGSKKAAKEKMEQVDTLQKSPNLSAN